MTDWIESAFRNLWADIWDKIYYYVTLSFLDPFYHWFVYASLIVAVMFVIAWFFGSIPWVRVICGLIIIDVIWGLFAYARGEREAREHDKPKRKHRR